MIALIITVLAVSLLALLLFPVTISFNSVRSQGTIDGSLGVNWIIFLFRYTLKEKHLGILVFGRHIFRRVSPEKKPPEPGHVRERKKLRKMPPIREFLNMTGPLLRLFKDFVCAFRIKYLDIDITFGMEDPAYTGVVTGFLHAAGLSRKVHNIRWTPDFTGQALDWDIEGKAALTPVQIIPPVARFVTNPKVLKSGWRILKGR